MQTFHLPRNAFDIKNKLVTREIFEERFKRLEFKLNILIALAMIIITFANPTFVNLLEKIFR